MGLVREVAARAELFEPRRDERGIGQDSPCVGAAPAACRSLEYRTGRLGV